MKTLNIIKHLVAFFIPVWIGYQCIEASPIRDGDIFWHLASGKLIANSNAVTTIDPFSFNTQGIKWININWLSQVFLFKTYTLCGYTGLWLFPYFTLAILALLYFQAIKKASIDPIISLIFFLLILISINVQNLVRPQTLSFLFFSIICFIISWPNVEFNLSKIRLLSTLLILAIWNQFHGGVIFGYFIIGLDVLGSILDNYIINHKLRIGHRELTLASICFLALLSFAFHPIGFEALSYMASYGKHMDPLYFKTVFELMPFVAEFPDSYYIEISLLIALYVHIKRGTKFKFKTTLPAIALFHLSLVSNRFFPFFFIFTAPHMAHTVGSYLGQNTGTTLRESKNLYKLICSGFIFIFLAVPFYFINSNHHLAKLGTTTEYFIPVDAVASLAQEPGDNVRVLSEFAAAGYITWIAGERFKIFIDGRGDLHSGNSTYKDYQSILNLEKGWRDTLNGYKIDYVLMPRNSKLTDELLRDDWKIIHQDGFYDLVKNPFKTPLS